MEVVDLAPRRDSLGLDGAAAAPPRLAPAGWPPVDSGTSSTPDFGPSADAPRHHRYTGYSPGARMDKRIRRATLRLLSNGIYVVTARHGDELGAATITWLTQVSFEPPLLAAAIRPGGGFYQCLVVDGPAAVHILASHQQGLAAQFFSSTEVDGSKINGQSFHPGDNGAPILDDALAYAECSVRDIFDTGGDHRLVTFEVETVSFEAVSFQAAFEPLTVAGSPWEYGG